MREPFSRKLVSRIKNSPYEEALNQILLLSTIIRKNPQLDFEGVAYHFSLHESEAEKYRLLENVESASELRESIASVKSFLAGTLGTMAAAPMGVIGGNEVFDEYLQLLREGFDAWTEVVARTEQMVDELEG